MARASIIRWVVASVLASLVLPLPRGHAAERAPAPFTYTWTIVFRGKDIGHALSRFSYLSWEGDLYLAETGNREFVTGFAGITVAFSEEASVLWDESGLMKTYATLSTVAGRDTGRWARRRSDGSVVWKTSSGGKVKEKLFLPDEFAYTDADRFTGWLGQQTTPQTLRILSLRNGKVHSITCRFLGRETVEIDGREIEVSRVSMEGPGTNGTFLIEGHGIPLGFTMKTFFGDFSFIPTGLY